MTTPEPILAARRIARTYRLGRVNVPVLRGVDIDIMPGESVAVLGVSGSGKSTLLHILGGLDRADSEPDSGVFYRGRALHDLSENELNAYRSESVGFVFQFYHLLPELNVVENVLLGAMIRRGRLGFMRRRESYRVAAEELLNALGMSHRINHKATTLSGGERQRVAIARALINHPPVLLADEPTGNLDRETGRTILDAIGQLRDRLGQTVVMVTHDPEIAARADRIVRLLDGVLAPEEASAAV